MPPIDSTAEPDDLRATIEAEFKNAEAPANDVPDAPEAAADVGGESTDKQVGEVGAAGTPAAKADHPSDPDRYADGTFKAKKPAEAAPEKVEAPAKETPSTDPAKASEAPASKPVLAPPAGWTAAEKSEWSKLSPAVQAAVSRREQEISRGGQQWSEEKRRYEGMLSPIARLAQSRGMTVDQGLNLMATAQMALDANPVEGLKQIARSYGVDLATLAGQPSDTPAQPDLTTLVRQAVAPMLAPIQQRFEAEENQRTQAGTEFVIKFAKEPGHEHYDILEPMILSVLPHVQQDMPGSTQKEWLQEAYDRAAFANPAIRASILASQEAEAEAQRRQAAQERAQKARLAAASVTGSPNGQASQAPADSLRAEIMRAMSGS